MNKDETIDLILSGLGSISIHDLVERAFDAGVISQQTATPGTTHGKLQATRDNELLQVVLNRIKEVKEKGTDIEIAIAVLTKCLKDDADYRRTWLANLSITYYDTYYNLVSENGPHSNEFVKQLTDTAAENFLNHLCNAG